MSLIHKALQKIEKKNGMHDQSNVVSPEEEALVGNGKSSRFSSTGVPPRTIGLIILTVLAAVFAVYMNYFAEKNIPKKNASMSPVAVSPEAAPMNAVGSALPTGRQADVMPSTDTAGVTLRKDMEKKEALSPEAEKFRADGQKLFLNGEFESALAKFREALVYAPRSPAILNSIGLTYRKMGDLSEAGKYYNEAIKNDPDCAECFNNLAVLQADQGDAVTAVVNLKKAIEIAETYADPYFNLAIIMEREGNLKSAVESYKKFLMFTDNKDEDLKANIMSRIEDLALSREEQ